MTMEMTMERVNDGAFILSQNRLYIEILLVLLSTNKKTNDCRNRIFINMQNVYKYLIVLYFIMTLNGLQHSYSALINY